MCLSKSGRGCCPSRYVEFLFERILRKQTPVSKRVSFDENSLKTTKQKSAVSAKVDTRRALTKLPIHVNSPRVKMDMNTPKAVRAQQEQKHVSPGSPIMSDSVRFKLAIEKVERLEVELGLGRYIKVSILFCLSNS